jgi:hypothetical protein
MLCTLPNTEDFPYQPENQNNKIIIPKSTFQLSELPQNLLNILRRQRLDKAFFGSDQRTGYF